MPALDRYTFTGNATVAIESGDKITLPIHYVLILAPGADDSLHERAGVILLNFICHRAAFGILGGDV